MAKTIGQIEDEAGILVYLKINPDYTLQERDKEAVARLSEKGLVTVIESNVTLTEKGDTIGEIVLGNCFEVYSRHIR